MAANTATTTSITGLSASTAYKVYFVAQDTRGNLQTSVSSVSLTTEAVTDVTAPSKTSENATTTSPDTSLSTAGRNFSMDFNFDEAVASVTDLSITNGGTGLAYQLLNGGTRVRVTGTAGTAGDTYISFTVKDAANNPRSINSDVYTVFDPAPPPPTP